VRSPLLLSLFAVFLIAVSLPAKALDTLSFEGHFIQGGLVIGQTLPGSIIKHGKRSVRVSSNGVFILGFGRDAKPKDQISVQHPGKTAVLHPLEVKKQTYKTSRINGVAKRKVTPKEEDLKRIRADNAKIGDVRKLDTAAASFLSGFIWPVKGRISGVFGSRRIFNGQPRRPHNGVDIAAKKGTPVLASADGTIALIHQDMFFSGKTVMIDHGHGLSSVYIHMNSITVKDGTKVRQGDQIGTIGMTGRATGPHLHWGVSLFKMPLDPKIMVVGEKPMTHTN
jgi:murein DD-endopeptidase MepM/ murein hydrolase activator NlpD